MVITMEALIGISGAIEIMIVIAIVVGAQWKILSAMKPQIERIKGIEDQIKNILKDATKAEEERCEILHTVRRLEIKAVESETRLERLEGWVESISGKVKDFDTRLGHVEQRIAAIDGRIASNGTPPIKRRR